MFIIYEVILFFSAVLDSDTAIELGLGNYILRKKGPESCQTLSLLLLLQEAIFPKMS